ncbi:MAG: GAF domain-containing protein, partial [Verrucomicrobiota bacterium]|nr:GAF domain-containing protein [Verrucomicrobiota bacterium]
RRHARAWNVNGQWWLEDLGSRDGTRVNGELLETPILLREGDRMEMGITWLEMLAPEEVVDLANSPDGVPTRKAVSPKGGGPQVSAYYLYRSQAIKYTEPSNRPPDLTYKEMETPADRLPAGRIELKNDMSVEALATGWVPTSTRSQHYLKLLLDVPRQFALQPELTALLTFAVGRLVKTIPGIKRACVLLVEPEGKEMVVRAHYPNHEPAVSSTLALRALAERKGFIWKRSEDEDANSESVVRLKINSGMYVPLLCGEQEIGVVCVDSTDRNVELNEEDLHYFLAFAQIIASCIQARLLQELLRENSHTLEGVIARLEAQSQADIASELRNCLGHIERQVQLYAGRAGE